MCKYCDIKGNEYVGKQFSFEKHIDGKKQNLEAYLFDSPEDEGYVIQIEGEFLDVRIDIDYCPKCGRKL